ncbi:hypothetical protein SLEP1_g14727 [Rubroshorea leprosula]|uniref:Maturase K n=1 Tax=Rubroshorea leprosula TaxID=152421 RepID=A0AAV5IUJ7_9ROSI|nr:hypothetical protein SLEP1_g14727 [Rubroshorea leprosula]
MRELVLEVLADLQGPYISYLKRLQFSGFIRGWHNQRSAQLTLFEKFRRKQAFRLSSTKLMVKEYINLFSM